MVTVDARDKVLLPVSPALTTTEDRIIWYRSTIAVNYLVETPNLNSHAQNASRMSLRVASLAFCFVQ